MKKIISLLIRFIPRKYLQRISGIGLKVVALFYIGSKVQCPICNGSYRTFLPYGRINPRSNALCPSCLSLERHRLIWLFLQQRTQFFNQKIDVLHIAPELCFIKRFQSLHNDRYITADLESPLAKIKMDIHHMPFEANSFDVVLCNHVLEHVENDILAMKEIHRVLRKEGFAILQIPFFSPIPEITKEDTSIKDPKERERLFGQDDHVRIYGKDYAERINLSGLVASTDDFSRSFTEEQANQLGINRNEILYLGYKK